MMCEMLLEMVEPRVPGGSISYLLLLSLSNFSWHLTAYPQYFLSGETLLGCL